MNPDSEDFKVLRQLMALKRHEQPPPGYFNKFSDQVVARIKSGERGETGERTWIYRFWAVLEGRPIFAGGFGAAVCAILISGILNSEEAGMTQSNAQMGPAPLQATTVPLTGPAPEMVTLPGVQSGSNSPSFELSELFHQVQLNAQPASETFRIPGGN